MTISIQKLVDQFGSIRAAAYLRHRFSKPENFFEYTSLYSELLENEVPEMHQEIVGMYMQGGRIAGCAPRGGAKSTVTGLEFAPWLALNGKRRFILYISDTFTQAKLHVGTIKDQLETNEKVRFVYPGAKGEKWGEEGIEINTVDGGTCFILPLGAGMKVRGLRYKGRRPDQAIIDDLENLDIVYSPERRKKLQRWFDFDLEPGLDRYNKNIIFIGTMLHYHALLMQVVHKKGKYQSWKTFFYKALDSQGKSFWESRYPTEYLTGIRDNPEHPDYVGSIVFSQEYQNEPQDDNDRIIKMSWIQSYNYNEAWRGVEAESDAESKKKWRMGLERVGAVDTAISEKEGADFFSFYMMGVDPKTGIEYMLDLIHDRIGDINQQVKVICDGVQNWSLDVLGIESVAYQAGLVKLVRVELQRRRVFCRVVAIKTDKDKIRRARIHSSAFEAGFIKLRQDHPKYDIIRTELEEFPLGEHDDAFDSLMLAREARRAPKARTFANKPAGL